MGPREVILEKHNSPDEVTNRFVPPDRTSNLLVRVAGRALFMALTLAGLGATIGRWFEGTPGLVVGAVIGAALGIYNGVMGTILAWLFAGPRPGAIRTAALMGSGMGLLGLTLRLKGARRGPEVVNALEVGGMVALAGGVAGAILGGFMGWLAGHIFRDMVVDMDAREFGAHRRQRPGDGAHLHG